MTFDGGACNWANPLQLVFDSDAGCLGTWDAGCTLALSATWGSSFTLGGTPPQCGSVNNELSVALTFDGGRATGSATTGCWGECACGATSAVAATP